MALRAFLKLVGPRGRMARALAIVLAVAAIAVSLAPSCGGQPTGMVSENLLAGRMPMRSEGVQRVERLTDNRAAPSGDTWNTGASAVFVSTRSMVHYDLGQPTAIGAIWLQGDNNDTYVVSVSDDDRTYRPVWRAGPTGDAGMRARMVDDLHEEGRYVRVTVEGGDGSYALSEIQIFAARPEVFPPPLVVERVRPPLENVRTNLLLFGVALGVALYASRDKTKWWWTLMAAAPAVAAGVRLTSAMVEAWPVGARELSLLRGMVAVVGALAVVREVWAPARFMANRFVVVSVLGICAALSLASFWNLGRPQFPNHKGGSDRVFVHTADMRVYYPVAKYWKELHYDGLYMASVAAYVDDVPGVTLESLARTPLRSLSTHRVQTVGEIKEQIANVHTRFTPERWQQFKEDMRYFRLTMGVRDYLGTMTDHGANATPVWMMVAHGLFMWTKASDTVLVLGGLLDPLLLLVAFVAIWRSFGIRTALVSAIVFGANDYYMFGTNWGGATLRHDWMAYLALGACALKKERWALGGAMLMFAAMIRAFPGFALIGTTFPLIWWLAGWLREHRKFPSLAVVRAEQGPWLRIVAGAAGFGLVAWLASSLAMGFRSWGEWAYKIYLLNRDPHVNHVSLRALLAGSEGDFNAIVAARAPILIAATVVFVALTFLATRRKHFAVAAMAGLILVPILMHPANYYAHLVFLLPMVVVEAPRESGTGSCWRLRPSEGGVWVALLVMCGALFFTTLTPSLELHFYQASAILVATLAVMLLSIVSGEFGFASQTPVTPQAPEPDRSS